MSFKRLVAVVLTAVMLVLTVPTVNAAGNIVFSFSSDIPSGSEAALGDTVTYTVSLDESSGFSFGTLYFAPSDNLTYVRSTYKGKEVTAEKAITGENEGAYGIIVMDENLTAADPSLCTVTFKVTGKGSISVRFYAYQLNDGNAFVSSTVNNGTVTHAVKELAKPVITTEALPEAVLGYEYSHKITGSDDEFLTYSYDGTLPTGLALEPDGTLHGTPTQFGSFKITVKANLLGELESDGKEFTLTVLEKPRALELEADSGYQIDGDLLRKVTERTNLIDFLANFKNNERIKVFDLNGNEVTSSSALIGTGYTVSLMHGEEKVHTVTIVVLGDLNGNGRIDIMDYQRAKMCLFGSLQLDGAFFKATLILGRPNITIMDCQRIKMHLFGTINIYE